MKGLNNLGNTCYLNSGLQMLIQNLDLCTLIYKYRNSSKVLNSVSEFINEYYNSNSSSLSPKLIKKIVERKNKIFIGFGQQDSSEFILIFLDFLNDEINKVSEEKDQVYNIFNFTVNTKIKCKYIHCLNVTENETKEPILFLDINEDDKFLDDCYKSYKENILLEEDNRYFCEKCDKKRIASKKTQISNWGDNLIIVLKRYKKTEYGTNKILDKIMVPFRWRHGYILQGVVYQSGNLNGGHYMYAGVGDDDQWYLYNDSQVTLLDKEGLSNIINYGYIYYYVKDTN